MSELSDIIIGEAFGPDAWNWAYKHDYVREDHKIEEVIRQWHREGCDITVGKPLAMLIISVAAAYLEHVGDTYVS